MNEFSQFETENQCTLSSWYKGCILSNRNITMKDRPYEQFYLALKYKLELLKIINNDYLFCMNDPIKSLTNIYSLTVDVLKKLK